MFAFGFGEQKKEKLEVEDDSLLTVYRNKEAQEWPYDPEVPYSVL